MGGASEGCSTSDGSSMESSGGCTSRTPHVQLPRAMMSWAAESGMARSAMVCTRCATVAGTMAAAVVASGLLSGTAGMAAGAILRVAGIYGACQGLFALGWLNHVSASFVLILGFVIEAGVVVRAARGGQPDGNGQGERDTATAKM